MTKTVIMVRLNQRLQAAGLQTASDTRPSVFLAQVMGSQAWEEFWNAKVQEARQTIQAYVWQGEVLPTGRPAPAEAVPGASYVIVAPSGAVIFQYGDSPYAPETPGLAPGTLTHDNVEQAMEAHAQALAEELALEELAQAYINWVAEQVL
jgi:enamine deaminase RidA (YjgF/YER057c/UK114 family)